MHSLKTKRLSGSTLPVIDTGPYFAASKEGRATARIARTLGEEIRDACHTAGMFYLIGHNVNTELIQRVLAENAMFFGLSQTEKERISCKFSENFRGYGLLKNSRDWREQIHLGVGNSKHANAEDQYWKLEGPNLWPAVRTEEFQSTATEYIDAVESLARVILTMIAEAMGMQSDFFTSRMKNNPYLLAKFMSYLPQPQEPVSGHEDSQSGVTAHCDWSWLTFLIQDNVGGLEACDNKGTWHKVAPLENAFVVNTGELLEIETGGHLRASPHRVINDRIDRQRFSNAVFINPDLDAWIYPDKRYHERVAFSDLEGMHVHKVIRPGTQLDAFVFGDSEWKRKGEGKWCYQNTCLTPY